MALVKIFLGPSVPRPSEDTDAVSLGGSTSQSMSNEAVLSVPADKDGLDSLLPPELMQPNACFICVSIPVGKKMEHTLFACVSLDGNSRHSSSVKMT
mmetsp:Transcript_30736/g.55765  ORF Transcript_30736/g.55765 Transcript_30736/m.55765 type:complete len:97 (+) Transcript_30736:1217-1507(+)